MTRCRGCGTPLNPSNVFCDLGAQPLANALLSPDELNNPEVNWPLRPLVCGNCTLVQLPECPAPETIFTASYPFYSGQSATWLGHCKRFADEMVTTHQLGPLSRVLDIGANDGSMLRPFRGMGIAPVGVEPCAEVAQHALMEGLPIVVDWWNTATAKRLLATRGVPTGKSWKADLVICTNVLAHVPDLRGFLQAVKLVLAPSGVAVFEVPYLRDLVAEGQFDQIYAEHHCYFSLTSLKVALEQVGLTVRDVQFEPIHGGSLRVTAATSRALPSSKAVISFLRQEKEGCASLPRLLQFAAEPPRLKRAALHQLAEYSDAKIVGYGASAKAAVTCNYFGLGPEWIDFIADTTSAKWGKYLPGSRIPIRDPAALRAAQPDVVINFAWNWAAEAEANIHKACPNASILQLRDRAAEQSEAA